MLYVSFQQKWGEGAAEGVSPISFTLLMEGCCGSPSSFPLTMLKEFFLENFLLFFFSFSPFLPSFLLLFVSFIMHLFIVVVVLRSKWLAGCWSLNKNSNLSRAFISILVIMAFIIACCFALHNSFKTSQSMRC